MSTSFDNSAERAILTKVGIEMPAANHYLETIAQYAIRTDFGRRDLDAVLDLEAVST